MDDFSAHSPFGSSTNLPIPSADNGSDSFFTGSPAISDHASLSIDDHADLSGYDHTDLSGYDHTDPSGYDHTDPSGYDYTSPSGYDHTEYSGSDLATHPPPSSNAPSDVPSAVTSDSDLPQPGSSKQAQQSGLLNFFSVVPAEDSYSMWRKRKRDNLERDEEERAETMRREEKWKEEKAEKLRSRKRLNQQTHRKKEKAKEIQAGIRNKDGKKLPVSHIFTLGIPKFIGTKVIAEKIQEEVQVPSHSEVAATSRPRKPILSEVKRREKESVGKVYTPSKRDAAALRTINWKSPTYWPMIEAAARQQTGKPNLSKLVKRLQDQHPHFRHLTHRRLSEWRDKTVKDKIEWSKETIATVKKEFLPGGHQTKYNIFVSIFK